MEVNSSNIFDYTFFNEEGNAYRLVQDKGSLYYLITIRGHTSQEFWPYSAKSFYEVSVTCHWTAVKTGTGDPITRKIKQMEQRFNSKRSLSNAC